MHLPRYRKIRRKRTGNERSLTIYQTICVGTRKTISSLFRQAEEISKS